MESLPWCFVLGMLVACTPPPTQPPPSEIGAASTSRAPRQVEATFVETAEASSPDVPLLVARAVSKHCGSCHDSTQSDNDEALAVFDLVERSWAAGLSSGQWDGFSTRLTPKVDQATQRDVERFVARSRSALSPP